jgi:hypothetical protein
MRYDLQVIFKGASRGVTSVNRSKYMRSVNGVGRCFALGECMKWWCQDPLIDHSGDLAAGHIDDGVAVAKSDLSDGDGNRNHCCN